MEIDRALEKEDTASQDNIFPESKANMFSNFGQGDIIKKFHEKKDWSEKYQIACKIKDPRANFIFKRLIFDECPEILSEDDFKDGQLWFFKQIFGVHGKGINLISNYNEYLTIQKSIQEKIEIQGPCLMDDLKHQYI